jgi:hypothetical protein
MEAQTVSQRFTEVTFYVSRFSLRGTHITPR